MPIVVQAQLVIPLNPRLPFGQLDPDLDLRLPARRQAADGAQPTPSSHGLPKAAARRSQVPQEAEGIQKVGFPRRVGANETKPVRDGHLDAGEVSPIA